MMADFDYGKAEADLDGVGCPHPDEIYDFRTEKGFNSYMRENGLNPDNYRTNSGPGSSSGSGSGYGSSGTEGCYITTACVAARGLLDDCEELTVLRSFRDQYLKRQETGETDIRAYYTDAPKVVAAINARDDASSIWERVYTTMIQPCVMLIKEGKLEETYQMYKEHTKALAEKYL